MTDIVAFIGARLDEDEQIARAATAGPWTAEGNGSIVGPAGPLPKLAGHVVCSVGAWNVGLPTTADAAHIVRHDPARVLREVAAKRRVLERHQRYDTRSPDDIGERTGPACAGCATNDGEPYTPNLNDCPELRDLASVWSDHPDYDQAWTVET